VQDLGEPQLTEWQRIGNQIDYATCRACFRCGEIRILKSNGAVDRIIPFNETDRRL
jgi:hypothetical protein